MNYTRLRDPDSNLTEFLSREFEVDFIRARTISRNLSFGDFAKRYDVLESLLDGEIVKDVIKNGSFLDYSNGFVDEYFRLVRFAVSRYDFKQKGLVNNTAFYSIDSLTNYLDFLEIAKRNGNIDTSKIDISRNKLFDSSDAKSAAYLSSLIDIGRLTVVSAEHWCKSKKNKGPRSLDILRKIAFQLTAVFSNLCLGRPEFEINHGTATLTIDTKTRENLSNIRKQLHKN